MPGFISACLICCAAAFLFFIAIAIYAIARGGMFIRIGGTRMRPNGNSSYGNGYDGRVQKLESIRSSEKIQCEKCGEWADAGDSFCKKCGAPLEDSHKDPNRI